MCVSVTGNAMIFVMVFAITVVFSIVAVYLAPDKFPAPKPQLMLIQAQPTYFNQNQN